MHLQRYDALLAGAFFMCFFSVSSAQVSLPFDFELATVNSVFTDFDGGNAEVVANPAPDAVNESASVAKIVRDGGLPWAGSLIQLDDYLDFSEATSIRMKVWSPRQGVRIKFKLEGDAEVEGDQWNVTQGGWETMHWNFVGAPSMLFNKLVFMFDFENVGDGSAESTFYFDDIEQVDASDGLATMDLPATFEDPAVDPTTYDFWGAASQIVEDPTNPGNNVVEVVKMSTAAPWAGTVIGTLAGLANPIPFTAEELEVSVRVWTPEAGTPILLKAEMAGNPIAVETIQYSSQEGWETLTWNFGNELPNTPEIELGFPHNLLAIFFGFGEDAVEGGATYYFDDVYFGEAPVTNGVEAQAASAVTMFPNPVDQNDLLRVAGVASGTTATVVDAMGRTVWQGALAASGNRLGLRTGTYTVHIQTVQGTIRQQLLVR